jgi:hypothetical protein
MPSSLAGIPMSTFSPETILEPIPLQSVFNRWGLRLAESLKSINKVHPTAKPNNYRQTSPEIFSALLLSH